MNRLNLLITCAFSVFSFSTLLVEGYLGINWGRLATQRMIPSMVVDLLMQNKIKEVKIFSASDNVMEAFGGTGIGLAITIPNDDLSKINTEEAVEKWIDENVTKFNKSRVNFRYVAIGTQPLSSKFFNKTYSVAVDVLEKTQRHLDNKSFDHIKAIMSHYTDVLTPVNKPSEGEFKEEIKEAMIRSCRLLQENNAPIGVDIFPLLAVMDLFNNDTEFAFFENNSTSVFKDGDKTYSNIFEVMYDTYDVALEKLGFANMTIIVGEIGWPTDAIRDGNIPNAQRFHQGLAKFIASNKGTPRRPGPIDAYIHNLADENAINVKAGAFMRHWGIYKFDGQPKFNIDLEGLGRNDVLVSAIGITHMPKRWCIFNHELRNVSNDAYKLLDELYYRACNVSDCTAAAPGGTCSRLQFPLNYSYGFNMGFQANSQKVNNNTCNFKGYGLIVADDPSTPNCTFPVEILAAENPNYFGRQLKSLAYAVRPLSVSMIAIMQFLFIFFTLICTC